MIKIKKKANPKPTASDYCVIDGTPYAQLHEIFYGDPNARLSQDHGLQVRLSRKWHTDHKNKLTCHPGGVHHNSELDIVLKVKAQMQWMIREDKTEEDFIKVFGVNAMAWEIKARESVYWDQVNFKILPSRVSDLEAV